MTTEIRCLTAANPSPLTGAGTNTYLIGSTDIALIDPGPDLPGHLAAILECLGPRQRISHIVVTHAHSDHSALAPCLAALTGAPVWAYGGALDGRSAGMAALATHLPEGGEGLDLSFRPSHLLAEGDCLTSPEWELAVLHTPGHLGSHICLSLGDTLISGDHVMGWSTTIVSPPDGDMANYMTSLRRLLGGGWQRFLPGHGPAIADPEARVRDLLAHRLAREAAILEHLRTGPARIDEITARVYHGLAPNLLPAARRNVLAHLIDLASRNEVTARPALHPDAQFMRN